MAQSHPFRTTLVTCGSFLAYSDLFYKDKCGVRIGGIPDGRTNGLCARSCGTVAYQMLCMRLFLGTRGFWGTER